MLFLQFTVYNLTSVQQSKKKKKQDTKPTPTPAHPHNHSFPKYHTLNVNNRVNIAEHWKRTNQQQQIETTKIITKNSGGLQHYIIGIHNINKHFQKSPWLCVWSSPIWYGTWFPWSNDFTLIFLSRSCWRKCQLYFVIVFIIVSAKFSSWIITEVHWWLFFV